MARNTSRTSRPAECIARASLRTCLSPRCFGRSTRLSLRTNRTLAAVIAGDDRYRRALDEVTQAKATLDDYRDNIALQRTLGMADWGEGLKLRKDALDEARRALGEINAPKYQAFPIADYPQTEEEREAHLFPAAVEVGVRRDFFRQVFGEIGVHPRGAERRIEIRWAGSEDFIEAPLVTSPAFDVSSGIPVVEAV